MTAEQGDAARASSPVLLAAIAAASGGWCVACGGGLPLLHPARTLETGEVRVAAGFSGNVATGDFAAALQSAQNEAAATAGAPGPPATDATYAKGALVAASVAPGLAPVAGARVGIGGRFEGGVTYTGRALRADLRRSFDLTDRLALSIGAGGTAALYGHQEGTSLPNVDLGQLHGWGADVPVLLGYASEGDLYLLWIGGRAGWEHIDISEVRSEPKAVTFGEPPIPLSATRVWGGGLVGFAIGFRHLHVAMELDVSYANVTGDYGDTHAQLAGWTVSPATAAWWRF
jgi:hypothetical protein